MTTSTRTRRPAASIPADAAVGGERADLLAALAPAGTSCASPSVT